MVPKFKMVKRPDGLLEAADDETADYLKQWKAGSVIEVDAKFKRNGPHHRKGMAILRYVFDNQDRYSTFDGYLVQVKILTGHCRTVISDGGTVYHELLSIAFDSMDEAEFTRWKRDAVTAIFEYFIPAMEPHDQDRVINNLIGWM